MYRESEREENKASYFIGVRGKDAKHNFFGQGLSADKKAICIPQSFGGFGLFGGCIFVNTGPSELLNLSVHKRGRAMKERERERERADEVLYMLRCKTAYIFSSVLMYSSGEPRCEDRASDKRNMLRAEIQSSGWTVAGGGCCLCDSNSLSRSIWDQ